MPGLSQWLPRYALPSLLAIAATYAVLRLTQRTALRQSLERDIAAPTLTGGGRVAAGGIVATALLLVLASALDWRLGPPTCLAGALTAAAVLGRAPAAASPVLRGVSWGVLPLVAGLFVLVEALDRTGVIAAVAAALRDAAARSQTTAAWAAGLVPAVACNLMNNLPAGLIAGTAVQAAGAPDRVTGAVLIGIDLGPNLSVTGSLATILWLSALRREGHAVGAWRFLRLGALVMPPALLLALGALILAR
jgi:arsenical pump membrane protein